MEPRRGCPILWVACKNADIDTVKRILPYADVNESFSIELATPLHVCMGPFVWSQKRYDFDGNLLEGDPHRHVIEIVKILLDSGANPLALTSNGQTPLHWAMLYAPQTEILKVILQAYPDLNVNSRDLRGFTALMYSYDAGSLSDREVLFQHGADLSIQCSRGETVLFRPMPLIDIKYCIENGANLNIQRYDGKTPIHSAIEWFRWTNKSDPVQMNTSINWIKDLLSCCPDLEIKDVHGLKPEQENLGRFYRHQEIEQLFLQHHLQIQENKMAFAMVLHERLGASSHARELPEDLVRIIWRFPGLH
jgi:hypothetical protein